MRGRFGRHLLTVALLLGLCPLAGAADPFSKQLQGKLSDGLNRIAMAAESGQRVSTRSFRNLSPSGDRVSAVIELTQAASRDAVAARVRAADGSVEAAAGSLLKVTLSPRALRQVASDAGVKRMRAPFYPSVKVTTEGDAAIRAPEYRARTGIDGAGVAVAVMDAGFEGALDLLGSELPAGTLGTDYVLGRIDSFEGNHGTSCAEIVHDVAPGADILLAAFEDEVTWAAEIDALLATGVPIISHSIGFDNLFPPDGNNYFAAKVEEVAAAGVLFVTAAGNEAEKYYQGSWQDLDGDAFLEFGQEGYYLLPIVAAASGTQVVLRWDDPFGASNHDYDLLVVREDFFDNPTLSADNPAIVAFSADLQNGAGNPREIVNLTVDEDQVLYVVVWHDTSTPVNMSQRFWIWAGDGVAPYLANASGTLTLPGDARGALTVGAVTFDSGLVEGFSSRGPTADGRVKPDVAGPDGVSTASRAGEPFFGTSAATPHVAGAAALLLARSPGMRLTDLRAALERATTSGGIGKNNDVGYGLIDLNRAP